MCIYTYIYIYIHMYTYTHIYIYAAAPGRSSGQDSSKGAAVEAGCSGLHHSIGCFVT